VGNESMESMESVCEMDAVWSELRGSGDADAHGARGYDGIGPPQLARCVVHRAASIVGSEISPAASTKSRDNTREVIWADDSDDADIDTATRTNNNSNNNAAAAAFSSDVEVDEQLLSLHSRTPHAPSSSAECSGLMHYRYHHGRRPVECVGRDSSCGRSWRIMLARSPWLERAQVCVRSLARMLTYTLYDLMCLGGMRDAGRIGKILIEATIDEALPTPPTSSFSLARQFVEYLVPCGLSSLILSLHSRRRKALTSSSSSSTRVTFDAAFVLLTLFRTAYRMVRQAIIYRLFFRVGSRKYYLVTTVAIIAAFFREECLWDLFNVRRWPSHFCAAQGQRTILRTVAYSLAFALPLERVSSVFSVRRRRGNAKKLTFFSSWIIASRLFALLTQSPPTAHLPRISSSFRAAAAVV